MSLNRLLLRLNVRGRFDRFYHVFIYVFDLSQIKPLWTKFFWQIGVIEINAFLKSVILEGYRIAGIIPPSVQQQLLSMCPAWNDLSTTDAQRVLDAIEALTVPARLTGITDENILSELIGDIAQTEIVNMTHLTVVRQRAMIFNGSAVWDMRRADAVRKLEAERLKLAAK